MQYNQKKWKLHQSETPGLFFPSSNTSSVSDNFLKLKSWANVVKHLIKCKLVFFASMQKQVKNSILILKHHVTKRRNFSIGR